MERLVGLRHLRFPLGALHLKRELAQMVDRLLPGSLGGQTRDLCLQDPAQLKKIRPADAKWLYRQELGYIESLKGMTVREIAEQRIEEITTALRKYML